MAQAKLDIGVNVETLNMAQIEQLQRTMQQLGVTTDQLGERTKTAMAATQQSVAPIAEEGRVAGGTATAVRTMANEHENAGRAAYGLRGRMSDLQNVLSNAAVSASMGGSAFSNLAWGLMFSPTSTAIAFTGVATAAYATIAALVSAEQQSQQLADRTMQLSALNNISVQEGQAYAVVLEATGIKTNDLSKAQAQLAAETGDANAMQRLLGEAAASGAVATDQQTAAMLHQRDASVQLSLAWQGLQLQMGTMMAPALTNIIDGYAQLIVGMNGSRTAANGMQQAGAGLAETFRTLLPPLALLDDLNKQSAKSHNDAALAARNRAAQEKLLNDQLRSTSDAVNASQQSNLRLEQANLSVASAVSNLTTVEGQHVEIAHKESEASQRVAIDQQAYTEAVKKHGASSIEAQRADLALEQAQDALNKTTQSGSHESLDLANAQEQAKAAILGVADAAGQNYDAQVRQAGATASAAARADAQVAALRGVEAQLAPDSPLRVWLDQYIGQLNTIPASKSTTITEIHQTIVGQQGAEAPGFRAQTGGIFTRPTLTWVGDAGPEAVVPLSRARRADTAPGASPLPRDGVGGQGHTFNFYGVNNPDEIAQTVMDKLRDLEYLNA